MGISALGLDHTSILGNTIEEIAQAKAGIMKPQCQAYTVTQPPAAMEVLNKVAREVKVKKTSNIMIVRSQIVNFGTKFFVFIFMSCFSVNSTLYQNTTHMHFPKNTKTNYMLI